MRLSFAEQGEYHRPGMATRVAPAQTPSDLATALQIRHAVFIVEQGVPAELEADGLDLTCDHFLAWSHGVAVATARTRKTSKGWKLERVAVLAGHRRNAVGTALVHYVLEALPGDASVYIHAQESALGFWERAGFSVQGARFDEAGIAHRLMLRTSR